MIRNKQPNSPIIIDLTGPQGNAYFLLGAARKFARQMDLNESIIIDEMMASDYEHLLLTFDQYFGSFVILER